MSGKKTLLLKVFGVTLLACLLGFYCYVKPVYFANDRSNQAWIRGTNANQKNLSQKVIAQSVNEGTLIVQGSSELSALYGSEFHPAQFYNYEDRNLCLIGEGYYQSLQHAVILGSLEPAMINKKAALIISVQWFTEAGINAEQAASRFSLDHLDGMMRNPSLSADTKEKLLTRLAEVFPEGAHWHESIKQYQKVHQGTFGPVEYLALRLNAFKDHFARAMTFYRDYRQPAFSENKPQFVSASSFNWPEMMDKADQAGKKACTNNEFYIDDGYYNTYVKDQLAERKGSAKDINFKVSPEYGDLRLYLQTAQDLGVEVALLMIPLQDYWSDYTGLPPEVIREYADHIQKIASEFDNVTLYDHMKYGYEKYYFKDIMHLGWKGWLYVQKDLYDFQHKKVLD